MEEIPKTSNNPESKTEQSSDPKKIGDLLFKYEYEIPPSEPVPKKALIKAEQDPKVIISRESRENLRARVSRYKQEKSFRRSKELTPEPEQIVELYEAQFDRRREAIGQHIDGETTPSLSELTDTPTAVPQSLPYQPGNFPPPTPPPPYVPTIATDASTTSSSNYKKPLIFGLLAGVLTGIVLIVMYLKK